MDFILNIELTLYCTQIITQQSKVGLNFVVQFQYHYTCISYINMPEKNAS